MRRAGVPKARKTRNKTPPRRRNGLTRDLVTEATSGEKEHAEVASENENKVRRAKNGSGEASTEGSLGDKRLEGVVDAPFDSGRGIVAPQNSDVSAKSGEDIILDHGAALLLGERVGIAGLFHLEHLLAVELVVDKLLLAVSLPLDLAIGVVASRHTFSVSHHVSLSFLKVPRRARMAS